MNETDSRYTFTYDDMGRTTGMSVLSSNMPSVRLSNTYDGLGRRTAVEDNLSTAGKISFTYDAANRTTNVKMTVGGTVGPQVTFTYDAASRLTNLTRQDGTGGGYPPANQVLTTFSYDDANRMTAITHTYKPGQGSSSTLATYTYGYNAASEVTTESNQDGSYTYTYDKTGQLTGVDASGGTCGATGCDESFSYDVNGNRTMTGYTTGTGNRLTSDGTFNYTYDDNGNMLTKTRISDSQRTELMWDYRDRLTQVLLKNSGGTILQQSDFTYDAFNRRMIKSFDDDGPGPNSATVTETLYDSPSFAANPYADFDGSNTLTMRYVYGPTVDMILARRNTSGTVTWYLTDHLGTVHDLFNTSGTVQDHISYSAYGKVTAESNPSNGDRFKFTAREYESGTALYNLRSRSYDSAIARFVSTDPIGFAGGQTNTHAYVGNAPTRGTDPLGFNSPVHEGNLEEKPTWQDPPAESPPVMPWVGRLIVQPNVPNAAVPEPAPDAPPPRVRPPRGPDEAFLNGLHGARLGSRPRCNQEDDYKQICTDMGEAAKKSAALAAKVALLIMPLDGPVIDCINAMGFPAISQCRAVEEGLEALAHFGVHGALAALEDIATHDSGVPEDGVAKYLKDTLESLEILMEELEWLEEAWKAWQF